VNVVPECLRTFSCSLHMGLTSPVILCVTLAGYAQLWVLMLLTGDRHDRGIGNPHTQCMLHASEHSRVCTIAVLLRGVCADCQRAFISC
jgi:hypothetical protein